VNDLSGFAKELGILEGTPAYSSIIKRYPLVTTSFKEKCYQIQRDSFDYKFSWAKAKIEKVDLGEKSVVAENAPDKKPVTMTVVNINFTSGGQSFVEIRGPAFLFRNLETRKQSHANHSI
jgi:hypothetical protein